MSPLDEITKLLAGLSLGNSCIKTLESLRILLASVNANELRDYIPKIDVNRLFTCLNTKDREQIKLACETLGHILNIMPKGQALIRYEDLFLEGLVHPQNQVKELIISQLQVAADDKEIAHQLSSRLELLLSNLRLVGSDEISIASKASNVLVSLISQGDAANILVSAPVVAEMRIIASKSDTVRFRVYDLIITLCCAAEGFLAFCDEAQLLQPLIDEVSTDDILIQLNALELMRTLAACQHGKNYLENKGIFQKLAEKLNQATADPLASLIVPGLMKFFGSAAHFQPNLITNYPNFTDTMFNLIEDADISLAIIAVETLSFIATGVDGKLALNQLGNRMDKAMKKIGQLVRHANGDVRVKAMHSLAELIRIPPSEIADKDLLKITEKWFAQLDAKPIPLILSVMKQPFKDLRYASLDIFLQLSPQLWAQKIMSQQPGFIEFLLDRRVEPDKECLERKFEIVKSLSETANPESTDVWTAYALAQMRDHVREGPWFIRAQSSVAFESGS